MNKCIRCDDKNPPFVSEGFCLPCWRQIVIHRTSRETSKLIWGVEKEKMKVKIKSWKDLLEVGIVNNTGGIGFPKTGTVFSTRMKKYCEQEMELNEAQEKSFNKNGWFYEDGDCIETIFLEEIKGYTGNVNDFIKASAGKKEDAGKGRHALVLGDFKRALNEVVKVGTEGAKKYEDSNWLLVENGIERYTDAQYRHLLEGKGINKEDFGLLHAAHTAWNALAALELILREMEKNNNA